MKRMASLGYYCIAPDMRGYSEHACPRGIRNYKMKYLTEDILSIADALNVDRFHLVGHDWGALVGWNVVDKYSERIISWTALSVPYLRAFAKAMKIDPKQKKKVRYIGFFVLPIIPELKLRAKDFAMFRRLWKYSTPDEVDAYLRIFRRKGALTATLNYYRANAMRGRGAEMGEIETPTLFIWGNRDLAIGEVAANLNGNYMSGDYTFVPLDAGHWLIQSAYDDVERAILDHIPKYKISIGD